MKIYLVGWEQLKDKYGGGWTWGRNFSKGFELVDKPEDCDVYVISSIAMLSKTSEVPTNKKIVLRVDNVLKKSANRDIYHIGDVKITRMEAMKEIGQRADLIIYQSEWAKDYLSGFIDSKSPSKVIMNSGDESIFNEKNDKSFNNGWNYLYSRSSRHDSKGWHVAWYYYQQLHRQHINSKLYIVGKFSGENLENDFDFFNGENYQYLGFLNDPEDLATLYRSCEFIYPYYNDACSNTLIEAILCGSRVHWLEESGGAKEIRKKLETEGKEYFYLKRMNNEYKKAFKEII